MEPNQETAAQKAPAEKAPAEKAPAEKAPAEKAPAEKAPAEKAPAEKAPKRYAAFDLSYGRYVGGVRDNKREAQDIAKTIKDAGREAEVREVS